MKSKLTISLIAISFYSCNNKYSTDEVDTDVPVIQFGENLDVVNSSDVIEVEFLTLQTDAESIVGSIDDIYQTDNRIFVSDSQTNQLFCFDNDGKFISTIGRRGQGAGEYITIKSFFVNTDKRLIGIYDDNQNRLLYYSLDNHMLSEDYSIRNMITTGCVSANDYLIWNTYNYNEDDLDKIKVFTITDYDGTVENSFVRAGFTSGYYTGTSHPFYSFSNKIYGYKIYGDMTVYEINRNSATPRWKAKVKNKSLAPIEWLEKESNDGTEFFATKLYDSRYISHYEIKETSGSIMISYIINRERFMSFYNKESGEVTTFSRDRFAKDLKLGKISYLISETMSDKYIAIINPGYLDSNNEDLDSELKNIIEMNGTDANPIIVLFNIK